MNKNKIENLVKISELNAKSIHEINRITYDNKHLVPCESEVHNEEVRFTYDIFGLMKFEDIRDRRNVEKFRLLANVSELMELRKIYSFNLDSNNLYYDYSYNLKVLNRDIKLEESIIDEEDAAIQYKSLIGAAFIKKYSYADFYNGGISLLKSNKICKKYISLNSVQDIKNQILLDLREQEQYDYENFMEVKKKDYNTKKYGIRVMSLVIAGLAGYSIYSAGFLNPFNKNVIKGNDYYMEQDYEGVIKSLGKAKNIKFMELDKTRKYELAYSYIISESLSENQKKNILLNLTAKSDENILDYWIALGEGSYDEAIDLAKKLQDNELLLYALLNKDKFIQDDTKMSGEEKQQAQTSLKSEIDKLTEQLSSDETSLDLSGTPVVETETPAETGEGSGEEASGIDLVPGDN